MSDKNHSTIQFEVELDEGKIPEKIRWSASEKPEKHECEAFLVSIWDAKARETLRIDLWTKQMQKEEMDLFVFQTLMTLSETYMRANGNADLSELIRSFGLQFGEQAKVIAQRPDPESGNDLPTP